MKILGLNLNKVSAERTNAIKGKLSVKSRLDIEDIKSEAVSISKSSALRFNFAYIINYEPNIAKVEIKGSVIALDDKGESEDILKSWKDKKFNSQFKIALFNYIMSKCNLKALQAEEELGLPMHIQFPRIKPAQAGPKSKNPANYTG